MAYKNLCFLIKFNTAFGFQPFRTGEKYEAKSKDRWSYVRQYQK